MTQILAIHEQNIDIRIIKRCSDALSNGRIILAPSETGYCFIGDAAKEQTHNQFLLLREGHPKNKPFSLLCKNISQVSQFAQLDTQTFRVASRAWPGAYTFILACHKNTPKIAAGSKRKTVGVRVPSHPVLLKLLEEFERPLLVTSVTDEEELITQDYYEEDNQNDFWWTKVEEICARAPKNKIDIALDNDEAIPILVSTIVDFSEGEAILIRAGYGDLHILGLNH